MKKTLFASALGMLLLLTSFSTYAEDNALIKGCLLIGKIGDAIVDDRDNGVTYEERVLKNKRMEKGTSPAMHEYLFSMTQLIYHDLKDRSRSEISNAAFYTCMKNPIF